MVQKNDMVLDRLMVHCLMVRKELMIVFLMAVEKDQLLDLLYLVVEVFYSSIFD